MTALVRKLSAAYSNPTLQSATSDLFLGRRRGHLDPYHYSMPLFNGDIVDGANIWAAFLRENSDYVIANHEAALIAEVAPLISRFIGQVDEFVDLGPGSIEPST